MPRFLDTERPPSVSPSKSPVMDPFDEQPSYGEEPYEPQLQPTTFNFTNHDLIAGFNDTIKAYFSEARVPIIFVLLISAFTLAYAQAEGTLFGRSLAYLITDSVSKLNSYYPMIGITDHDTEDSFCNCLLEKVADVEEWKVDERFFQLGWSNLLYVAFFGSVKKAFLATRGRRA
jgi:hypothetical protein